MAEEQTRMVLSLGEQHTQREFLTLEEFVRWFSSEQAKWDWLTPADPSVNPGNVAGLVQGQFSEVSNHINVARGQLEPLSYIFPHLEALWGPNGYLRYSDGQRGAAVLDIRDAAGEEAAAFAYAFLIRQLNLANAANAAQLRGAILLAIPNMVEPVELAERLSKERANFKAAQTSAIARVDKARQEQVTHLLGLTKRARRVARRLLRSRYDNMNQTRDIWLTEANKAKSEIDKVRVAYEESMRLQGPVKYWSGKARTHGRNEKWATAWVVLFFLLGGGGLAIAFWSAADFVLLTSQTAATARVTTPTALYVLITGGLAALTTLTFWIGRLLTKLWMSEHHLRNDAHERAVMTTTYLALTRGDKAEDVDRQIILSALFRNTPDGIVKEEGVSEFGLQGLVAKFLAKP